MEESEISFQGIKAHRDLFNAKNATKNIFGQFDSDYGDEGNDDDSDESEGSLME